MNRLTRAVKSNQLPGPMSSGYEVGFDATSNDYRDLAPKGTDPSGMRMSYGAAEQEAGWVDGQDMRDMASGDQIPVGNSMGALSDDNMAAGGERASSAGFHLVGSGTEAGDISSAFGALENGSGQGGSSVGGPVSGYDSMRGIVLGSGSGPAPAANQETDRD